jgi:hypothetical protein
MEKRGAFNLEKIISGGQTGAPTLASTNLARLQNGLHLGNQSET